MTDRGIKVSEEFVETLKIDPIPYTSPPTKDRKAHSSLKSKPRCSWSTAHKNRGTVIA